MTNEHLAALSAAEQEVDQSFEDWLNARAAYHAELVRLHRANQIAVIGPDAVERCAAAMAISQGAEAEDWEVWLPEATAAIAALTGRV